MKKMLDREDLERLIEEFLQREPLCVIATCSHDIPRASCVEFFPLGATLYILTEGGKKIENIRNNPLVSLSVHGHFSGWVSVRGLQISGTAEIGTQGSGIFTEGTEAYRKRRRLKSAVLPDFMHVIKVRPRKIEYIDTTLEERGFSIRQELEYER